MSPRARPDHRTARRGASLAPASCFHLSPSAAPPARAPLSWQLFPLLKFIFAPVRFRPESGPAPATSSSSSAGTSPSRLQIINSARRENLICQARRVIISISGRPPGARNKVTNEPAQPPAGARRPRRPSKHGHGPHRRPTMRDVAKLSEPQDTRAAPSSPAPLSGHSRAPERFRDSSGRPASSLEVAPNESWQLIRTGRRGRHRLTRRPSRVERGRAA